MQIHRENQNQIAQHFVVPSHALLNNGEQDSNPFIAIPGSIYLLARLAIALYVVSVFFLATSARDPAPHVFLRTIAVTIHVLIYTLPLWYPFKGIGVVHPLYLISALGFLKTVLPNLQNWAIGVDAHFALQGMAPSRIALLQIQIIALTSLAHVCIYAGFFASKGLRWNFITFRESKQLVLAIGIISAIVGFGALYLTIDMSGGVEAHLRNISVGKSHQSWVKESRFGSIYAILVSLTVLAPALLLLRGRLPLANPLFWAIASASVLSAYLVAGRRSAVVSTCLILLASWILRRRNIAVGRLAIIGILLFLSIGIIGDFRRANRKNARYINFDAVTQNDFGAAFNQSFDEIQTRKAGGAVFPIVAKVPKNVPYLYGSNYFFYLSKFVPRALWPDKPRGIGIQCADVFYGRVGVGGVPPGAIGEAYWTGGTVGIIVIFLLWGMALRSIGNFFLKFKYSAIASLLYLATLTRLGPSSPQVSGWLYSIGPAAFFLILTGVLKTRLK